MSKDIVIKIKSKNPEDVTDRELKEFELLIEETINHLNGLQRLHRNLVGKEYFSPIRLRS